MRVSELSGGLLDYWVARAEMRRGLVFHDLKVDGDTCWHVLVNPNGNPDEQAGVDVSYCPSFDWDEGGPIIKRERIRIMHLEEGELFRGAPASHSMWTASIKGQWPEQTGSWLTLVRPETDGRDDEEPLIAAMRAHVQHTFGREVPIYQPRVAFVLPD
jgi:hypothetical protein